MIQSERERYREGARERQRKTEREGGGRERERKKERARPSPGIHCPPSHSSIRRKNLWCSGSLRTCLRGSFIRHFTLSLNIATHCNTLRRQVYHHPRHSSICRKNLGCSRAFPVSVLHSSYSICEYVYGYVRICMHCSCRIPTQREAPEHHRI